MYEAVRAGKKWDKTMLVVLYDDAGGYYDPVVPPFEGVPADGAPCHVTDQCPGHNKFDFHRLGLRTSAALISPWVAKGTVIQEPKGPFNTSQFDLTSIPATAKVGFPARISRVRFFQHTSLLTSVCANPPPRPPPYVLVRLSVLVTLLGGRTCSTLPAS